MVHGFPEAGLGVYVAADGGSIYESEVFAASHSGVASPRRSNRSWGDRAVLVLIGHRLGLDGVNPIYYDALKVKFHHSRQLIRSNQKLRNSIPGLKE